MAGHPAMESLGRLTAAAVRLRTLGLRASAMADRIEQRWTRGMPGAGGAPLSLAPRHGVTVNGTEAGCDRVKLSAADGRSESACVGCQFLLDAARWLAELRTEEQAVGRTIASLEHVAGQVPKLPSPESPAPAAEEGGSP